MRFINILLLLELIFAGFTNCVLATSPVINLNEEQVINIRNKVLVNFFENKLGVFSQLAYNNAPITPCGEQPHLSASIVPEDQSYTLIYNQDVYVYEKAPSDAKKGTYLRFNEMPIGYNIYVPETPKGILVEVYGGGGKLYIPNDEDLKPFHKSLLNSNIVTIRLNLVDRSESHPLRLGARPQQTMSEATFTAVQESIHHFCSTFKSTPEILHEDLKYLKGLPIFLFGHSFGGLVTLCQAQRHLGPDSFDGYIGLNAGLSGDMPGWIENRTRCWYLNSVNDDKEIQKITKPILLLQATTDSNVNMEATNNWAKKARKILFKKQILLKVIYSNQINPAAVEGDGHYIPQHGAALKEYVENIHHFMTTKEDLDRLSAQTALTVFQWELYANKLLRYSTVQEQFLSEAFKFFKAHPKVMTAESFETDWEEHYKSLFNVIYLFEEFIKNKDLKDSSERRKNEIEMDFPERAKDRFKLGYTLWSIRENARDEKAIEKTLLAHLPLYLSFIKGKDSDYKYGNFTDQFDEPFLKSLITDKVVDAFWNAMTNPKWWNYRARYTLALSYFLKNPKLSSCVEPYTDKSWWTADNEDLSTVVSGLISQQQEKEIEERNKAKAALKKVILKNQKKEAAIRST